MIARIKYLWEELNASFWFIPSLMLGLAVIAAVGFLYLDTIKETSIEGFSKYLLSGGVDSARSMLTIIAGAMIGIAGTVFSITLVALTLASSQLGPRLLRNFMYDKLNQVVLGTYVSTFVYCLIVTNSLTDSDDIYFVPVISVFVGLLAAIAGNILLIVFIHHISVSIQSDKVISDISDSMLKHINTLFPDKIGQEENVLIPDVETFKKTFTNNEEIRCRKTGYLRSVNSEKFLKLATDNELLIIFNSRPGDYLVKDLLIGEIFYNEQLNDDMEQKINNTLIIGKSRTPLQDAEYSLNQMVEIALRALSPGINDPYTAIACVDNLSSVLCFLATAKFPSSFRFDKDSNLRVIAANVSFSGMLNAAFNQIRQNASGNPAVLIRLLEALITIDKFSTKKDHKVDINRHASMVLNIAEQTFNEPKDLNDLKKRYEMLISNQAGNGN